MLFQEASIVKLLRSGQLADESAKDVFPLPNGRKGLHRRGWSPPDSLRRALADRTLPGPKEGIGAQFDAYRAWHGRLKYVTLPGNLGKARNNVLAGRFYRCRESHVRQGVFMGAEDQSLWR